MSQKPGPLRPLMHLNAVSKMYPNAWTMVDDMRADKGGGLPDWPAWCFVPLAGFYAIVCDGNKVQQLTVDLVPDVARLAAIGAWRYTQGVYRFDNAVYQSIATTMIKGDMPCEVLYRLPQWGVYIDTPNNGECYGFWAHLEYDINTTRSELRLVLDTESDLTPLILHLGNWTVTEAVDRALSEALKQGGFNRSTYDGDELSKAIISLSGTAQYYIALLLYLCSDQPDIARVENGLPQRAKSKKTKKGWKLFPPKKPVIWQVGQTLAQSLTIPRNAGDEQRKGPIAHIRRAHWHGFWRGKKDTDERTFGYKWLPPQVINAAD
jgi:hypothetical protein